MNWFASGDAGAARDDAYYNLLGVPRDASDADIKKAYRRAALRAHPDRGGDAATFQKLQEAYGVLSDTEQRKVYDTYGKKGLEQLKQQKAAPADASDLFGELFGFSNRRRQPQRGGRRRAADLTTAVEVGLEDLYLGKEVELKLRRVVQRDPHQQPTECRTCGGVGEVLHRRRLGPGFMQQVQAPCDACNGAGYVVDLKQEQARVRIHVERGMRHGQRIRLSGEAGVRRAGELPGDLVCVLRQRPHPTFHRRGDHLLAAVRVPLAAALSGAPTTLRQLDGRPVAVHFPEGHVVAPGSVCRVSGKGMPVPGTGATRWGDLLLRFAVDFPRRLSPSARDAVASALRGGDAEPPERADAEPVGDDGEEAEWSSAGDEREERDAGGGAARFFADFFNQSSRL